jgi:hypothetical protein
MGFTLTWNINPRPFTHTTLVKTHVAYHQQRSKVEE